MGFVKNIIEKHKAKVQARNEYCDNFISKAECIQSEIKALFVSVEDFIEPSVYNFYIGEISDYLKEVASYGVKSLKKAKHYDELLTKQTELQSSASSLREQIAIHNRNAAELRIQRAYELIGKVEGRELDRQQMNCIVKDVHNHLVIAGAGTGKTTTVVGKIKYLLKSEKYRPEDILVLSFTNASASEMKERIQKETKADIDASTFHKLGLNIIRDVDGIVPQITQLNLSTFVKEKLQELMEQEWYLYLLGIYLLYNRVQVKSEFDFKTLSEYNEYLALNPPTTVKKELVKSYGEMNIANFLAQNGVEYIYEYPYPVDTRTTEYGQYHPDFYLPEYDIYIEYFGVNRNGEVPSYFQGKSGMTPTQTYQAAINWKRELHKANETTMVECYAYENMEGTLLDNLKNHLEEKGVELKPKTAQELWAEISEESTSILDGIIELFETLINLIKSNGYTISDVRRLNIGNKNARNNDIILTLLEPIFNAYCSYLTENKEIDFNDMIIKATEYIKDGRFINPYKYVIVDEYQDISKARFSLLKALRDSSDYDLFCVGDDWQSIYRFAGSDIGYILGFENYWGASEISRIETTYRFSDSLIEISSGFIMKNPYQIKKSIRGQFYSEGFALEDINGYTDYNAIDFMAKKLNDLPKNSTVYFIGRYTFDRKLLKDNFNFECSYDNTTGFEKVVYKFRHDLKMYFLTAHRSKGLQADYVFIINNKRGRMGFPSKIQDAEILNLLLERCEPFPDAEERRLFYVALTRAKEKAFLLTINGRESSFVLELRDKYQQQLKAEQFKCPLCGGRLIKRTGPYGEFFGCSNYRTMGCTYKRNITRRG